MDPQDAISLATRLAELFTISPPEFKLVQTTLEKFPYSTAEAVVLRYSQETATFDRGKLRMLLWEEHSRRAPRVSVTAGWKDAKEAENKARDELLSRTPNNLLQAAVENLRKKCPDVFRFIRGDLLQTDFGKGLVYAELKHRRSE